MLQVRLTEAQEPTAYATSASHEGTGTNSLCYNADN